MSIERNNFLEQMPCVQILQRFSPSGTVGRKALARNRSLKTLEIIHFIIKVIT